MRDRLRGHTIQGLAPIPGPLCGQVSIVSVQPTMTKTKQVPRFGPLFYCVFSFAVVLGVTFFGWQAWRTVHGHITTQRYLTNLRDPKPEVHQLAVQRLLAIGADYSPILIQLLNHEDAELRRFACEQLGALRPPDESALVPLIRILSDTDPMVRCYSVHAIAAYAINSQRLGPHEEAALRHLCNSLHDENADVREASARALGQFGTRSPLVLPALTAALDDKDPNVRLRAAWSLYEIDHDNLSVMVPIIKEVLSGDDASAHSFVMGIIGALGPLAEEVMPDVVKELNRRSDQ